MSATDKPTTILVTIKIPAWKSEAKELIEDLQYELGMLAGNLGGTERDAAIEIGLAALSRPAPDEDAATRAARRLVDDHRLYFEDTRNQRDLDTILVARALLAMGEERGRLEHKLRQEREQRESLERRHRNLIDSQKDYGKSRWDMELRLDALLWVWCSGGCETGVLRYTDLGEYDDRRVAISEEVIRHAIDNTKRLVLKWRNLHFRPLYERYLNEGHPWRVACDLASAELDRLYPGTHAVSVSAALDPRGTGEHVEPMRCEDCGGTGHLECSAMPSDGGPRYNQR